LLTHEDLAPWYEKAVWIYVCRTWREDTKDKEAERIHTRFGITSWPHLLLIHPGSDEVLVRAGRNLNALSGAFERAADAVEPPTHAQLVLLRRVEEAESDDTLKESRLLDRLMSLSPHVRAQTLASLETTGERAQTPEVRTRIVEMLSDPDVVVRYRALTWLLASGADSVFDHAEELLLEDNDTIRFALLEALAKRSIPKLAPVLTRLVLEAGKGVPSGNPNVLRGRAARCLVTSGDASSIDALAPIAREANARNTTTRTVVEALGAIADRSDEATRKRVIEILLASYPDAVPPLGGGKRSVVERYAVRLAEAVTRGLGQALERNELPKAPEAWSEKTREAYLEEVTTWVRKGNAR
jgi:HEAT repeat protein